MSNAAEILDLKEKIEIDSATIQRLKDDVVHYALKINEKNNELFRLSNLIQEIKRLEKSDLKADIFFLELKEILEKQ